MDSSFDDETLSVTACDRCPRLVECRSRIVNGTGPADADVVFIGEAPGANEDKQGIPFVGQSGKLLSKTLGKHGIPRTAVRITNTVRCRPPDNRDPTQQERDNCLEHLNREIAGIDPDVIVTLGKVPSEQILEDTVAVSTVSGETFQRQIGGKDRTILVSVHPAATMYDPSQSTAFETTIERAAELAGNEHAGQADLTDF